MPATEIVNATGKEGCIPKCTCTYREKQETDGEKPMSLVPTHGKYQVSTGYLAKLSGSHGNIPYPWEISTVTTLRVRGYACRTTKKP